MIGLKLTESEAKAVDVNEVRSRLNGATAEVFEKAMALRDADTSLAVDKSLELAVLAIDMTRLFTMLDQAMIRGMPRPQAWWAAQSVAREGSDRETDPK